MASVQSAKPLHVDGGFAVGASSFNSPWIATLLKLRHGVIGHGVSLLFSQTFFQAAYDFAGAPQREGNRVPEGRKCGAAFIPGRSRPGV
jgi:hypothetical protein